MSHDLFKGPVCCWQTNKVLSPTSAGSRKIAWSAGHHQAEKYQSSVLEAMGSKPQMQIYSRMACFCCWLHTFENHWQSVTRIFDSECIWRISININKYCATLDGVSVGCQTGRLNKNKSSAVLRYDTMEQAGPGKCVSPSRCMWQKLVKATRSAMVGEGVANGTERSPGISLDLEMRLVTSLRHWQSNESWLIFMMTVRRSFENLETSTLLNEML